jgi:hypothetical protein
MEIQITAKISNFFNASIVATAIDDPIAADVAKAVDVWKVTHVSIVANNSKTFDVLKADHVEKSVDVSKKASITIMQKIQENIKPILSLLNQRATIVGDYENFSRKKEIGKIF